MKFIDSTVIYVRSGKGGPGLVSFRAARFKPKLGPDGGDGGFGGSVYLVGEEGINTLSALRYKQWYEAEDGSRGGPNDRTGKNGADLCIKVPLGTVAIDDATGAVLAEVVEQGEKVMICKGGKRGIGNARYVSSTRQQPTDFTAGGPGERYDLRLELKLLADVGLAGFPNAGKSTLVSLVSAAKAKVGDYPFTTLVPQLGVVDVDMDRFGFGASFVLADIPGLIEGAHAGRGLGHEFLKHLERTKVIVYLLDSSNLLTEELDLLEQWQKLKHELQAYNPALTAKPDLLVVNKCDLFADGEPLLEEGIARLEAAGGQVMRISAATGAGVGELKDTLFQLVRSLDAKEPLPMDEADIAPSGAQ